MLFRALPYGPYGHTALAVALALACLPQLCAPAQAEVNASGTRLSVAGGPGRFYMTYGVPEEPAFYAPVIPELNKLGIRFVTRRTTAGDDEVVVSLHFKDLAVWPVVRTRQEVPDTGETPCVLIMGGNVFVPVWKVAELVNLEIEWTRRENMMTVLAGRGGVMAKVPGPVPSAAPAGPAPELPLVTLSAVSLEQVGSTVQVRVDASGPVNVKTFSVKAPNRVVIDFMGAKWGKEVPVPEPLGAVQKVRVGQFNDLTARLALTVPSMVIKVIQFTIEENKVVASIGAGSGIAKVNISPELREAIKQRTNKITQLTNRSGNDLIGTPRVALPAPDPNSTLPVLPDLPAIGPATGNLRGRVICLDAGHGGTSPGAVGLNHMEKDLCLKMTRQFQRSLEALGATVIMTREDDSFVSLEGRVQFANTRNADLFISIHCNSMPRRNMQSGSETYYHTDQSALLARAMQRRLVAAVQGRDGGVRNRRFYVIKYTQMPSVLLEIAYINNTKDEMLLAHAPFHSSLANSLAQGVLDYFTVAPTR